MKSYKIPSALIKETTKKDKIMSIRLNDETMEDLEELCKVNGLKKADVIKLVQNSFEFIKNFDGEIPGNKREECGNYKEHDLDGAKKVAEDMVKVLADWTEEKMNYEE